MAEEVSMALLIVRLTLVGTLVASQPLQAVAQMGRVSGQVTENGTNRPVAGARVFVVRDGALVTPTGAPPATVTDQDGLYRFDALPAGGTTSRLRRSALRLRWSPRRCRCSKWPPVKPSMV